MRRPSRMLTKWAEPMLQGVDQLLLSRQKTGLQLPPRGTVSEPSLSLTFNLVALCVP
jgi:hypothetical protein